jgi:hypothetical protein
MPTVALEVVNPRLAERSCEIHALPLKVGRGADCGVQLDPENRAISRVHLELVEEDGRIVLINRASNPKATVVDGRSLGAEERVVLEPGQVVRIFDTELALVEAPVVGLGFASRSGGETAFEVLAPGRSIVATERADGRMILEPVAELAAYDQERFAGRLALVFYLDAGEPCCAVVSNPAGHPLMLDRSVLSQTALALEPFDLIEIDRHRIEIRPKDAGVILCEIPSCRGLNPDGRGMCRLCGAPLAGCDK